MRRRVRDIHDHVGASQHPVEAVSRAEVDSLATGDGYDRYAVVPESGEGSRTDQPRGTCYDDSHGIFLSEMGR